MDADHWKATVVRHFAFVEDYGFHLTSSEAKSWWETSVVFTSHTGGIKVAYSNEFVRAEVNLIRLVDGVVPPYPIWITAEQINWVLLDNVLEVRDRARFEEAMTLRGLDNAKVNRQLQFWADCLRTTAGDFLRGDMAPIDEAAELIRARVKEHPQEMTIWVPDNAPTGAEGAETERARRDVPPEVTVRARRYWRKKPPS